MTNSKENQKLFLKEIQRQGLLEEIQQIKAALLHLENHGKLNYDAAREKYNKTSDELLQELRIKLAEKNQELDEL